MTGEMLIDILSWILLVAGSFFCFSGAVGLFRFPDFFTRMHAASVTDTLGAGMVLMGLMLQAGLTLITVKLLFIFVFLLLTGPAASHAMAKSAIHSGHLPKGKHYTVDMPEYVDGSENSGGAESKR